MDQTPPTPALARGVVSARQSRIRRPPGNAPSAAVVLLITLALLVVVDLFLLPGMFATRPAEPSPSPTSTGAALLPDATPTPSATVSLTMTPIPTASPSPVPTLATPTPSPMPTEVPTPQPTPQLSTIRVRIQDDVFLGDYNGAGSGTYHGRTATWIYGQGTPYHTMTATFDLGQTGRATGQATLRIVGLEGSEAGKQRIAIVLNGTTIYEGRDPLPNDFGTGPSGPGNWGSASFEFKASLLQRTNLLSITNLTQADCTTCPDFVLIDYVVVEYNVVVSQ